MPLTPTMSSGDGTEIAYDPTGDFAYVAGELLVIGESAVVRLAALGAAEAEGWRAGDDAFTDHPWIRHADEPAARAELIEAGEWPPDHTRIRVTGIARPLAYVRALRAEGHVAQPNHVFVAHGCSDCCGPHPSAMTDVMADPMKPNPMKPNPMKPNPMKPNPMKPNPMKPNPMKPNSPMDNLAAPAAGPTIPARSPLIGATAPRVLVLDTGIASARPPLLADVKRFTGDADEPDVDLKDGAGVVHAPDHYLDPVAGHGTFIAGVTEQLAPGCSVHVHRVITPWGIGSEDEIAAAIEAAATGTLHGFTGVPDIINLSFGGHVMEEPFELTSAVNIALAKGIVVVASAGNDATCRPQYPAALDGVIAVGALGPDGPAPWTNYGCWVDACAPGTELVSAFFHDFDGDYPMRNTVDADKFADWASWSGTSFAAPVVVAAIAREMVTGQPAPTTTTKATSVDGPTAAERVIHAPHLMRLPGLGTVIST